MGQKRVMPKSSRRKDYNKLALALQKKMHGPLSITVKKKLETRDDWSTMYTPGVAAVASHVAVHPKRASEFTIKRNSVAVISDGTAVLGLGDIGPYGALPVMEGKCAIFKERGGVDAFPIVLDTQDVDEIVKTVKHIAPGFGGINLEDISAPRCFEIEARLHHDLDIPVMHDDQHASAIIALAGLINASKVVGKKLEHLRIVVVGAGAAGHGIAMLLHKAGIEDIIVTDSNGMIYEGRGGLAPHKKELSHITNRRHVKGDLLAATEGADALVGVSGPGVVSKFHIEVMAPDPIVFALANPVPEIKPEDAYAAGAKVVATGRSDYPNQVNNSLVFPGFFRGALDRGVTQITDEMKLNAAKKIAALVKKPTPEKIVPGVMEPGLVKAVASAIR
jgi:malate dehydrogenase (oxaloacetate-decarboxylating)